MLRTQVSPVRVPRRLSGWVTVTNTDLEEGGSANIELDRVTRNPAVFRVCLTGLTPSKVLVHFNMGLHGRQKKRNEAGK